MKASGLELLVSKESPFSSKSNGYFTKRKKVTFDVSRDDEANTIAFPVIEDMRRRRKGRNNDVLKNMENFRIPRPALDFPVPQFHIPDKLCKYFLMGNCHKGEFCTFSHDASGYPCKYFHAFGFCDIGPACVFGHEEFVEENQIAQFIEENKDFLETHVDLLGDTVVAAYFLQFYQRNDVVDPRLVGVFSPTREANEDRINTASQPLPSTKKVDLTQALGTDNPLKKKYQATARRNRDRHNYDSDENKSRPRRRRGSMEIEDGGSRRAKTPNSGNKTFEKENQEVQNTSRGGKGYKDTYKDTGDSKSNHHYQRRDHRDNYRRRPRYRRRDYNDSRDSFDTSRESSRRDKKDSRDDSRDRSRSELSSKDVSRERSRSLEKKRRFSGESSSASEREDDEKTRRIPRKEIKPRREDSRTKIGKGSELESLFGKDNKDHFLKKLASENKLKKTVSASDTPLHSEGNFKPQPSLDVDLKQTLSSLIGSGTKLTAPQSVIVKKTSSNMSDLISVPTPLMTGRSTKSVQDPRLASATAMIPEDEPGRSKNLLKRYTSYENKPTSDGEEKTKEQPASSGKKADGDEKRSPEDKVQFEKKLTEKLKFLGLLKK